MRKRQIEFVMKTSKFCNLRCTYCYEYNELSDRRRLAHDDFQRMLENLKEYSANNWKAIGFVWHGGEPLLIKPAFYDQLGVIQENILGDRPDIKYLNVAQSNLTALGDETLEFLESKRFFRGIGVSVDPFGTERVDTRGRLRNDLVFENMQRLRDRNYEFACITVLTPKSLPFIEQTFNFFDTLGVRFRVLPYDVKASDDQAAVHSLSAEDHIAALTTLFDLWLASSGGVRIDPLDELLLYAMRFRNNITKRDWDLWRDETVYTVELDGSVWGRPHGYEPGQQYGNLIEQDLETILTSSKRQETAEESSAWVKTYCGPCPYFGYCPGRYVGNSTDVERALLAKSGCWLRPVMDHIVMRLDEIGIETFSEGGSLELDQDDTASGTAIANA